MAFTRLLTLALAAGAAARIADLHKRQAFTPGQAVNTTSGVLRGIPGPSRPDVSVYLGIPYAKPPVGERRFAAPERFVGTGEVNATAFVEALSRLSPDALNDLLNSLTPPALQLLASWGQAGNAFSEDCLTLNVWTKPQTGEKAKAVLFWIYGGGFESGATNNPTYSGEFFADNQDVVFVSANYRTNIFGFPGLPGVKLPQNPGLLDQRLALEWVRDNIAAFGGDPNRITIFGQSAGGASVDYYTFAHASDPIAAGAIAQSGTAVSFTSTPAPSNNTAAWYNASATLGCGGPGTPLTQSVACVRGKSTTDLLSAIVVNDPIASVLGNFGPTTDGVSVFADYATRGQAGKFAKIPLLIGNNDYEAGLFRLLALGAGRSFPDAAWCLFNADIYTCPASTSASWRARNGVPVWRYRYYGEFPNTRLTWKPNSGPWHGAEIPVVFGTEEGSSAGVPDTPAEVEIGKYLQSLWAGFAKDPKGALSGQQFKLPKYSTSTRSLILFAQNNQTAPNFANPRNTDAICPTLDFVSRLFPGGLFSGISSGSSDGSDLDALLAIAQPIIDLVTAGSPPPAGSRCKF
ncbi:alpha/beta-hydrolase [Trichodelitschia bisporula]|uniref:Carboxylic ester hydrolase n=1 Tax=Trichodelitschia bisporula TaxID=703511 RepID=A0A6G1HYZ3_9PEZI|nr:alpha/beta-hydrolase [Trichodelitschia bisporula]